MGKRIGEFLLEKGLITKEAIERALKKQNESGVLIGQIFQAEGMISTYRFYKEFAAFKGMEFVNLDKYKSFADLLRAEDQKEYYEMQYIPFEVRDGKYLIATTDPTDNLNVHLSNKYKNFEVFVTSPLDILWKLQNHFEKEDSHHATENLFLNMPEFSSRFVFDNYIAKTILVSIILSFSYLLSFKSFITGFLAVMNCFFLCSLFSKVLFFTTGMSHKKKVKYSPPVDLSDKELPVYSILVPLYKEKYDTVNHLIAGICALDYPKEKLDVKLVVENDDIETINSIKFIRPSSIFQIIRVPKSYPRTKPKACNYALRFCRGEFVTIYDAEDLPDPMQLKKVLGRFASGDSKLGCVQARLNYYNRDENILTRLFSIEYASWFDNMLYGLQKLGLPIPLGGTSNHFRTKTLRALYAWDPFNVTEDADLGVRISLSGLNVEVVDSLTLEEAPISFHAWLHQRVRWVKGHIQTYVVHMRRPLHMYRKLGLMKFLGFFFFVGAPSLIYLMVPIVFSVTLLSLAIPLPIPAWLVVFSLFNLLSVIAFNFVIGVYIVVKNKWRGMIFSCLCFPLYWVLHSLASFGSFYQLIKKPHHWNKTEHGVTKIYPGK